jgi:hypothetical protein
MAGAGLLRRTIDVLDNDHTGVANTVSVNLVPRDVLEAASQQINLGLRLALERAGFQQPDEVIEAEKPPPADPWRIVAPGVIVRDTEYQVRYAPLGLSDLGQRMSPDVFSAYVRHVGAIEGYDNVDVNELVRDRDV